MNQLYTHTYVLSLLPLLPTPPPSILPQAFLSCPQSLPFCQFLHRQADAWILLLIQSLLASQLPDFLPGEKVNFPEFSLLICVLWAPLIVCINSFPEGREKLLSFLKGRKIRVECTFIFTPWHAPAFTSNNSTPPSPPH